MGLTIHRGAQVHGEPRGRCDSRGPKSTDGEYETQEPLASCDTPRRVRNMPAPRTAALLLGAATWCGRQDRSVEEAHVIQYGALMPVMARTQAVLVERSWR